VAEGAGAEAAGEEDEAAPAKSGDCFIFIF
jgi:hypothetical protein